MTTICCPLRQVAVQVSTAIVLACRDVMVWQPDGYEVACRYEANLSLMLEDEASAHWGVGVGGGCTS